jgi:Na+-transporting NADH:ubiquinone oxidoreductase subunit C
MSETIATDSTRRALGVALAVAFVCAVLVSAVAVGLRPLQKANVEAERIAQLELVLVALSDIGRSLSIDGLEARIVELGSGQYDDSIDVATFDAEAAAAKPGTSDAIPADLDVAGIKRRARHSVAPATQGFTWCATRQIASS